MGDAKNLATIQTFSYWLRILRRLKKRIKFPVPLIHK